MMRICLAMMILVPVAAYAQGTTEQRGSCMSDAFQFCSAYIPDEKAIEDCLSRNLASLTPACRAQFDDPAPPPVTPKRRR